jgi:hypothetical protein
MSLLLRLPSEIHVEVLVWLVIRCFNKLVDDNTLVDKFEDLYERFDIFIGLGPDDEEDEEQYIIEDLALVFATTADVTLEPYLAACSMARLCWRSHRRVILHRAAAESLKVLNPRIKAVRRMMMRTRFQQAVWRVINTDLPPWIADERSGAEDAWMGFYESTLDFWSLDYRASALRSILSDQIPLDRLFELSRQIVRQVSHWCDEIHARPPQRRVRFGTKRAPFPG